MYDDGTEKINTSTWDQVARAVTSLMSMKILPDDEHDTSPSLDTHYRNKFAYVSSFLVSQRDMFDSLKRVTGTTDSDWSVTHQPSGERYREGLAELKSGVPGRAGYAKLLYARCFYPTGDGAFESKRGLANSVLGLPEEDLDECTKGVVERCMNPNPRVG